MSLISNIKNKGSRISDKEYSGISVMLLRNIILMDGIKKIEEEYVNYTIENDKVLIISISKDFPTLHNLGINLDEYEKYNYPKTIVIKTNNQTLNIAFYNKKGTREVNKIDGYHFICEGDCLVRFGTMSSNVYTNCVFDMKYVGIFHCYLGEDVKPEMERPLLITSSIDFEPEKTYLNTEYLDLKKIIFNNKNNFLGNRIIDLYYYNIYIDLPYIGDNINYSIEKINICINKLLNPNKNRNIPKIMMRAIGLSKTK